MYSVVGDSFGSRLLIESIHQERTFLSCLEYNFLTPLSKMNHKRKSRRIARCPISYYWDSIQQQNVCYKTNVCVCPLTKIVVQFVPHTGCRNPF